jgi:large conductance mechanosensitive channel
VELAMTENGQDLRLLLHRYSLTAVANLVQRSDLLRKRLRQRGAKMHYKDLMASETLKEFREFILKGNAFDLAVGVIVGAAFGTIVTSLVGDILMPPIGMLLGNVNFSDYFVDLTALKASALGNAPVQVPASYEAAKQSGHAIIAYGKFLNALINLLIVGAVIFFLVKQINRLKQEPEKPKEKPENVRLLIEIRDLLAKNAESRSQEGA